MSVQRSPTGKSSDKIGIPGGNSSSQPDLSTVGTPDYAQYVSQRKRKLPEDDFSYQFEIFKKEIMGLLKEFGNSQTENINIIKKDISSINEQLTEMKTKTDQLIVEHSSFKTEIQNLSSTVNENQEKIKGIENDVQALQSASSSSEYSTSMTTYGFIMTELQERMERSKNIVITGVSEPQSENIEMKRENDRCEVKKILSDIHPSYPEPGKIIRLGKYDGKKTRPLKVCFSTSEVAKIILKNKSNYKGNSNIKIYSDQTPNQKQDMTNLREELRQRKEKGESDLIIKYIKGIPKIINQQTKNEIQENIQ